MGPNIIYDRASNMSNARGPVPDGCQDRLSQEQLVRNGNHQNGYQYQDSRNGSHESRTSGSPFYHQHFERQSAEQEQQKFLLNNGIQWGDCQPEVRRKLDEMFFRGTDLRYSPEINVRGATSLEDDASGQYH